MGQSGLGMAYLYGRGVPVVRNVYTLHLFKILSKFKMHSLRPILMYSLLCIANLADTVFGTRNNVKFKSQWSRLVYEVDNKLAERPHAGITAVI